MTKKGLLTSEQAEDVLHLLGQREVRTLGEITIALSHLDEYMRIQQLTGCYDLGALATGQHCTLGALTGYSVTSTVRRSPCRNTSIR